MQNGRKEGVENSDISELGIEFDRMPAPRAFVLGVYLIASFILQVRLLVELWPVPQSDGNWATTWDFWPIMASCEIHDDARLISLVLVAGGVGAMVHALRSFSAHIGARRLSTGWAWWYILRPFEGAVIALAFYLVLRGGLISSGGSAGTTADNISVYGVAAIAVLVGMFSHEAVTKLKELAETLFSKTGRKEEEITDVPSRPKPIVTGCEPREIASGTADARITVSGSNFVEDSEVRVDGASRPTVFISANELQAVLSLDDAKHAGRSLNITVFNKPPAGGESAEDITVEIK